MKTTQHISTSEIHTPQESHKRNGGHCHHHDHSSHHGHHHHHHSDSKNLGMAFWLNLAFSVFEFIGGFWAGSMAILSDAVHDLGDALSLGVAWYLQKVSHKGRDKHFSYGYKRFSLLGALFISVILAVGSTVIIIEAVPRLFAPGEPRAGIMFLMAIVGLLVNGFAAFRLSKGHSLNERAVMLHLMEDVLGWLAVLIVSCVLYFVEVPVLDPLLSIAISVWVLYNVACNLYQTLKIMLQAIPQEVDTTALQQEITNLSEVESVHDFHLWSLDGEKHILSLHLVLEGKALVDSTLCAALKERVREIAHSFGIDHVTIEIDAPHCSCGLEEC